MPQELGVQSTMRLPDYAVMAISRLPTTEFLQLIKHVGDGKKADVLELQLTLDRSK